MTHEKNHIFAQEVISWYDLMTSSNSEKNPFLRREVDGFFQTHEGGDFYSKEKECSFSMGWKALLVTMEPKAPPPALSLGVL